MAIVKLGPTIVGIRGTIGGITFSNNKSGPYAQSWARGATSSSEKQSAHRANFASQGHAWLLLTAGQQALWDTYAAAAAQELTNPLGETFFATGSVWFTTINMARFQAGQGVLVAAPVLATPGIPVTSGLQDKSAGGSFSAFPAGEYAPDFRMVMFLAMGNTPAVTSFGNRHVFMLVTGTNPGTPVFFQAQLEAAFGVPLAGRIWEIKVARQNTEGRRSPFASRTAFTT